MVPQTTGKKFQQWWHQEGASLKLLSFDFQYLDLMALCYVDNKGSLMIYSHVQFESNIINSFTLWLGLSESLLQSFIPAQIQLILYRDSKFWSPVCQNASEKWATITSPAALKLWVWDLGLCLGTDEMWFNNVTEKLPWCRFRLQISENLDSGWRSYSDNEKNSQIEMFCMFSVTVQVKCMYVGLRYATPFGWGWGGGWVRGGGGAPFTSFDLAGLCDWGRNVSKGLFPPDLFLKKIVFSCLNVKIIIKWFDVWLTFDLYSKVGSTL